MHLKIFRTKKFIIPVFLFLILIGCEKEKVENGFIAEVNGVGLTNTALKEALESDYFNKKHQVEYIRQWIETELLYQEAIDKDILDATDYRNILERNKKELAAAYLLKDYFDDFSYDFGTRELKSYFNKYISDFKIFDDAYVINKIRFTDEGRAILFRYTLIESDWEKAIGVFKGDQSIISSKTKQLIYKYQVQPLLLFRIVKNLLPGEVSIVLETEPGVFSVVQLVKFLEKNSFPDYEYVEDLVKERYANIKKTQMYRSLIDELFAKYNVKFNKDVE